MVDAVLADPGALELIVVVDGTDDRESPALLTELGATTDRLRHLQTERLGQMGALAAGGVTGRVARTSSFWTTTCCRPGPLASGHRAHHVVGQGLVVVGAMPVDADTDAAMTATSRIYAQAYLGHCGELVRGDVGVLETLWFGNVSLARDDCRTVGLCNEAFRAT